MDASLMHLQEKTFDTGEMVLNYAKGPAHGSPVVLLHGLTDWWHGWEHLIPYLTDTWHVYAPDLRGHGKSGRGSGVRFNIEDYVRDIASFLREVVKEPAVLVGHSLGAVTALYTGAAAPEQVRGLVLCDPPLSAFHETIDPENGAGWWFSLVTEAARAKTPAEQEAFLQAKLPQTPAEGIKELARELAYVDPGAPQAALDNTLFAINHLPETLRQLACPVVFLQGEKSLGGQMWDEDAGLVHEVLPAAEVIKFPDVGHGTHMQVEAILAQLRRM